MSIENEIAGLTQSTTDLLEAVNTKKATLDTAVSNAQTAVTDATSQVSLAAAEKVGAQTARDTAETFKDQAYTYSQSAASAVAYQDLTAIAQTKAESARDVFVYDTSKDSDGGAWRQRTQGTSWYNETLNTATRGSRKEFPAVAVIVAEWNKVTIYDGDDPSMPMWMVFNNEGSDPNISFLWSGYPNAITALNGQLVYGRTGSMGVISFLRDGALYIRNSGANSIHDWNGARISERNSQPNVGNIKSTSWLCSGGIVGVPVNDVAMTVLPDAPIDPATGLPTPTIAVATDGGVSVIKDDGTVVDITSTSADGSRTSKVSFTGEDELFVVTVTNWASNYDEVGVISQIPSSDTAAPQFGFDRTYAPTYSGLIANMSLGSASAYRYVSKGCSAGKNRLAVDSPNYGVVLVDENKTSPTDGMISNIAKSYNTGWMNGDIKLATLSDTDDTDLVGSELVTNGTFDTDTSGWTAGVGFTLSVVSQQMKVTRTTGSGLFYVGAYQTISTVAGESYTISFEITDRDVLTGRLRVDNTFDGGNLISVANLPVGVYSYTFIATASTTYINFSGNADSNGYVTYDNISVRLAEPDRSVNGNGLQVFGTVQKSPVATGADLVAYSGFSGSNYLEQPYNPDLDFGTGDYCVMAWANPSNKGTQYFLDRQDGTNSATGRFNFGIGGDKTTIFHRTDSTLLSFNYTSVTGKWTHYTLLRKSGVVYVYVDGQMIGSASNTVDYSSSFHTRFFNIGSSGSGQYPDGAALLRISGTAPTAEQIKKIYEDEKVLFQENAKATLHGTSDAVTALAYDDSTELLHVGTSAGRSVFQGLRRVDNTTDAVGVAISASNNLVVEE